jgi:uncharacterized membrane protein YfcA
MDYFSIENLALFSVLGLVSGLFAGLLGIGGGVVKVPALTLLFHIANPLLVKGITFTCMIFTSSASALGHYRSRTLLPGVVRCIVPTALVGVVLGYLFGRAIPPWSFQVAFGGFLLYVIIMNTRKLLSRKATEGTCRDEDISRARACGIGLPMGLIAGVLGIGGGSVATPCQQVFLDVGLKNAIANSAVAMIPMVFVGFLISQASAFLYNDFYPHPPWTALVIAGVMVPGSVLGAYCGARLTAVLPVRIVRLIFVLLLCVTAVRMIHVGLLDVWGG